MRGRIFGPLAITIALSAMTAGGIVIAQQGGDPEPGMANVWWDADGGTCDRSATAVAYNDAAACAVPARTSPVGASLDGWNEAVTGDTIGVYDETGGNDYGVLTAPFTTKTVTVVGMGGEGNPPEFSFAVLACDNCTFENVKFENRSPGNGADHDWVCDESRKPSMLQNGIVNICGEVILDDFEINGLLNGSVCAEGVKLDTLGQGNGAILRNGSIHGVVDRKGVDFSGENLTFENIHFYEIKRYTDQCGGADPHNECLYTAGSFDDLTFKNNLLAGCPSGQGLAMLGTSPGSCGASPKNVLIEGNVFARTNEGSGADYRDDWHPNGGVRSLFIGGSAGCIDSTWTVRYNTFETAPESDDAGNILDGTGDGQWYGNLGAIDCSSVWAYHHNVGDTCGGANSVSVSPNTNTEASPNQMSDWYTDAFNYDFHLVAGADAIGAGDSANKPATDRDGVSRGSPPDAGAYERP